jgi:Tfp pilus assembly protein PilV
MLVEQKLQMRQVSGVRYQVSEIPTTPDTRHPTPRSGLSLTEVLIAMGILTLGLLGVASVFPVGSYYMQKAEIADKGSAIAQSVMNDIMARGMLNPRSWYMTVPFPTKSTPNAWNTTFPSDGNPVRPGTFTRSVGAALSDASNQSAAATDRTLLSRQLGSAYVIDPLGASLMAFKNAPPTQKVTHGPVGVFPAAAYNAFLSGYYASYPQSAWIAWAVGAEGYVWPIRRVTFRNPISGLQMDPVMAEHFFRGNDDLSFDFPARDDRPAIQTWDKGNTGGVEVPLARKWAGDYSWIVSVVPTTNAARDGMATNPEGFAYDVSVVVFYKRALPDSADNSYQSLVTSGGNRAYLSAMGANERVVQAGVVSTGLNGGELLLTDYGDYYDATGAQKFNAFEHLKSGNWIMLCGPHPNSNVTMSGGNYVSGEPRFVMNWYQVITIESNATLSTGAIDPAKQRLVTLRGPEWPWQPSSTAGYASDNLCVGICRGAVAVHTKTIRLESGPATFGNGGSSTTTPQNPFQPF